MNKRNDYSKKKIVSVCILAWSIVWRHIFYVLQSCITILLLNIIKDTFFFFYHNNMIARTNTNIPFTPPGLLCPGASLHPNQPLQTGVCWWQQAYGTSVCAPAQFHSSWLGVQCDGSPCLASSQLPQAAGISRRPVLCGGVPFSWLHLRAGSLPLHQQQGGSARVRLP